VCGHPARRLLWRDRMSLPRQIVPGDTWFITRRCTQRTSLLSPSTIVTAVFMYLLIYCAKQYGIMIHAACAMGTHYHLVITDTLGLLPKFMEDLNKLLAKVLNYHYGRWENFWAPGSYDAKRCVSVRDALDRMAYTVANPTAAGLVSAPEKWPGFITLPEDLGRRIISAKRPKFFFRPNGPMPEEVSMMIEPLPCGDEWTRDQQVEVFRDKLDTRRAAAHEKHDGRFLGARKVRAVHHTARPRTREPRRQPSMRIAAANTDQRIEAIAELREFHRAYREVLSAWRAGDRSVTFPPGTWWMQHHTPARVQKPPNRRLLS
jgi:putative transposase